MKNVFLALSFFTVTAVNAQKVSNKLSLQNGQKLEVVTNTNITAQSLMGPSSGTVTVADVYAVNNASSNAFTLVKVPRQMKLAFTTGSQEMKVDTDNPGDLNGPLGQPIKEIMSLKPEFTIDASGKVIAVKKDDKKKNADSPEAGMMALMMPGMNTSAALPQVGTASLFKILPDREVGVGDTWTDSSNQEGNRNVTVYKLKEITDKEIVVDFEGTGNTVTTQTQMGMNIDVNATSKGTGSIIIDKASGILKQKTITSTTETVMNLGGREMTMTSKTNSVMNVNVQ